MERTDRPGLLTLSHSEAAALAAVFDRMFPDDGDGYAASTMGAVDFVDRALAGPEANDLPSYRRALSWLSEAAQRRWTRAVEELAASQLDELIAELERGGESVPANGFALLRRDLVRGLFADPIHGGNTAMRGWRFLGDPGLAPASESPRSLRDWTGRKAEPFPAGFDRDAGRRPPRGDADVVIIGGGAVGSVLGNIDPEALERGVEILAAAETIYLVAKRRSYPIISYVAYAFGKLGVRFVGVGTASGIDDDILSQAGPRDAAFAVSFSPYASESAAQARALAARGVPVVSLTDSAFSPLADCSRVSFSLAEADHAGFRSLSASMAFAMALTVSVAERRRSHE